MKPGDIIEDAIWLDGREAKDQIMAYKRLVEETFDDYCLVNDVSHGPIEFTYKRPGDERVPEVPDHIEKKAKDKTLIRLLVGETRITGKAMYVEKNGSFINELDKIDLMRLRKITQKGFKKHNPHAPALSDSELDAIIEEIGPQAAIQALREHTHGKRFH